MQRMSQFESQSSSALVIEDRKRTKMEKNIPKGEAMPLRVDYSKMGERGRPDRSAQEQEKAEERRRVREMKRRLAEEKRAEGRVQQQQRQQERLRKKRGVLGIADDDEDLLSYTPRTAETRAAYEALLGVVQEFLGDYSGVPRSAADGILEIMKSENLCKPTERQAAVSQVLMPQIGGRAQAIPTHKYAEIAQLCSKITDWRDPNAPAAVDGNDGSGSTNGGDINEDAAVSVVFDDDDGNGGSNDNNADNDSDLDGAEFEVQDENDDDEEDEDEDDNYDEGKGENNVSEEGGIRRKSDATATTAQAVKLEGGMEDGNYNEDDDVDMAVAGGIKAEERSGGGGGYSNEDQDTVKARDIDAYWLQRQVAAGNAATVTAEEAQKLAEQILDVLGRACKDSSDGSGDSARQAENDLVGLLGIERFELIRLLMKNMVMIVLCTRLARAPTDDSNNGAAQRKAIIAEFAGIPAARAALRQLGISTQQQQQQSSSASAGTDTSSRIVSEAREFRRRNRAAMDIEEKDKSTSSSTTATGPRRILDLEALAFEQGGHLMSNATCKLPEGSTRMAMKGYDVINIPSQRPPAGAMEGAELVEVERLPRWARKTFPEHVRRLNYVQSKVFEKAYGSDANMLLCAPTGSGKTISAMLCMLREVSKFVKETPTAAGEEYDFRVDVGGVKIVYIAPMKSLVQEMAGNFRKRFEPLGLSVRELSGDAALSRRELAETQVVVTTPEKWDVITRKSGGGLAGQRVGLVIIDEIHLLHDTRGPVLEAVVARTLRRVEQTGEQTRLVGLSATLPNYGDVAAFLRVERDAVFAFDNAFRPVPLEQTYISVNERKALRRLQVMNDVCYRLVAERAGKCQVLIFVHSRKETVKTAKYLRDAAVADGVVGRFLREDSAKAILASEAANAHSAELRDLLPYGFAVHHAGLSKEDRGLVEELFADNDVQVLVSTATLAWGVNLPAHTVIIRGTQVYSPERGRWTELSPLDVMQMVGRAGRPQYDKQGEGILITSAGELQYYLSLLNHQLPIESQFISQLPDMLNAEVVLGNVQSVRDAVHWLAYTYLYVRMLRSPALYGAPSDGDDSGLAGYRADLVHSAAVVLDRCNLVKYDRKSGALQVTDLGRVAAHYYVNHESIKTYNEMLKPTMTDVELFRLFSMSHEFRLIPVRAEEKLEVAKLAERVPVPVKEGADEPAAKVNVLLQAYISRLRLDGFALMSDMVYVTQSAGRILRALFEIVLRRGWAQLAERTLALAGMVEHRLWLAQTPLRQFAGLLGDDLARKIERQDACTFQHLYGLSAQELGSLVRAPERGKQLWRLVHAFPKVDLEARALPLTQGLLRVDLTIAPDFEFDARLLGGTGALGFWVLVEDVDCERILHHEYFVLKEKYASAEHDLSFTVPLLAAPMQPMYFIKVVADRWLGAATVLPLSFRRLVLPAKPPPCTELYDLRPLPVAALKTPAYTALYAKRFFTAFNPIQTQVFQTLYMSNDNALVCAPPASGKTVCAELAILRAFTQAGGSGSRRCSAGVVYVTPSQAVADRRLREWSELFAPLGRTVGQLTGETAAADLRVLAASDVTIATPRQWDLLSRRWRRREAVKNVRLFVADDLHCVSADEEGATYEIVVSRMRSIAANAQSGGDEEKDGGNGGGNGTGTNTGHGLRIVGLAASVANAQDLGQWIAATPHTVFSFHPSVRPARVEIRIQGFDAPEQSVRLAAMLRPMLQSVHRLADGRPAVVYVPSKRDLHAAARALALFSSSGENDDNNDSSEGVDPARRFLKIPAETLEGLVKDDVAEGTAARGLLRSGIGLLYEGMPPAERACVERLFAAGAVQVVVATHEQVWAMEGLAAHTVVVMGTEAYDGRQHAYVDYPVSELLQMSGRACMTDVSSGGGSGGSGGNSGGSSNKCVVLCNAARKDALVSFMSEPIPVESQLHYYFHDHLNAEVDAQTIESMNDAVLYLSWSLLYLRLAKNPSYYDLRSVSQQSISDYLSALVQSAAEDLEKAGCLSISGIDLAPLNGGTIAAYYGLAYTTVETFSSAVTPKTTLPGLLEILTAASEYDTVPVRHHEEKVLRVLAKHLPCRVIAPVHSSNGSDDSSSSYKDPHVKANILLQTHFLRKALPADLAADQASVVEKAPRLLQALINVISSCGWLNPALAAMELSQLVTQALWVTDSNLQQLPHVTPELLARFAEHGVASPLDIFEVEDAERAELFKGLPQAYVRDIAEVCNAFPSIALTCAVDPDVAENGVPAGENVMVAVTLERELGDGDGDDDEEEEEIPLVHAPYFPREKLDEWWVVIGDQDANRLFALKHVALQKKQTSKLVFPAPAELGKHSLTVIAMCDSYLGCDPVQTIEFTVTPAIEDDDDSDDNSSDEEMVDNEK